MSIKISVDNDDCNPIKWHRGHCERISFTKKAAIELAWKLIKAVEKVENETLGAVKDA